MNARHMNVGKTDADSSFRKFFKPYDSAEHVSKFCSLDFQNGLTIFFLLCTIEQNSGTHHLDPMTVFRYFNM